IRLLTELTRGNAQDLETRKTLYGLALRNNDDPARTRWRNELQRIEGTASRSIAILDAMNAVSGSKSRDPKLGEWQDLARAVIADTPDHVDAHLLLAAVTERVGDRKAAVNEL